MRKLNKTNKECGGSQSSHRKWVRRMLLGGVCFFSVVVLLFAGYVFVMNCKGGVARRRTLKQLRNRSDAEMGLREKLSRHISCRFENTELRSVLRFFSRKIRIGIVIDESGIAKFWEEEKKEKPTVNIQIKDVPLRNALTQVLHPLGLEFWPAESMNAICISSPRGIAEMVMGYIRELPDEADKLRVLKQALRTKAKCLREEAKRELKKRGFKILEDKDGKYFIAE